MLGFINNYLNKRDEKFLGNLTQGNETYGNKGTGKISKVVSVSRVKRNVVRVNENYSSFLTELTVFMTIVGLGSSILLLNLWLFFAFFGLSWSKLILTEINDLKYNDKNIKKRIYRYKNRKGSKFNGLEVVDSEKLNRNIMYFLNLDLSVFNNYEENFQERYIKAVEDILFVKLKKNPDGKLITRDTGMMYDVKLTCDFLEKHRMTFELLDNIAVQLESDIKKLKEEKEIKSLLIEDYKDCLGDEDFKNHVLKALTGFEKDVENFKKIKDIYKIDYLRNSFEYENEEQEEKTEITENLKEKIKMKEGMY